MDTEIDVPNRDDKLVPGMYAEAHLHLADRPDVLNVPIDAVDGLGTSSQHAYVVRDGRIALITISTGVQTPDRVEILSGLREGDKVVVGRHSDLSDGQRVETKLASYDSQPTAKT
jgi:multidrug efflux pump subunit AcrA (membrane-fusion protein)